MMLRLSNIMDSAIAPAMRLLPDSMDSAKARVMLLSIGLQESRFEFRRQLGNGPARGFWQFEKGTQTSRGGVWGVCLHNASKNLLAKLCLDRDCAFDAAAIWDRLEHDDILAAGVARLMLYTNPSTLPTVTDVEGSWDYYATTWRPGKPHHETWAPNHALAVAEVVGAP